MRIDLNSDHSTAGPGISVEGEILSPHSLAAINTADKIISFANQGTSGHDRNKLPNA